MLISLITSLITFLPGGSKHRLLRVLAGWEIAPSATIGLSLFWGVRFVRLEHGARIGHFNVFRNMRSIELGAHSRIGQWNWFSVGHVFQEAKPSARYGYLDLGTHAAITGRHYVDCEGGVVIGSYTTIAGVRTTILSHQIDTARAQQTLKPTRIGQRCFIGSNVCVAPGTSIPDRCVVAMGAVVAGELSDSDTLYGGVPAKALKRLPDSAYFTRESGYVSWE